MKKFCTIILGLTAASCLTVGACADVISPLGMAAYAAARPLTLGIAAVLIVTILLIRWNGKKK